MKKLLLLILPLLFLLPHNATAAAQLCPGGTDGECTDVGGVTYECDTSQTPFTCVAAGAGTGKGNVGTGGVCTADGDCIDNLACIGHLCQPDRSLEDTGTSGVGGSCDPANNNNDCPGAQTCDAATKKCVGSTDNTPSNFGGSTGFVPLAPIPGLTDSQSNVSASSLAQFLQNLYKYLIGLAAILAVIQIIRGGLEYATQDNVSKKGEGREHIEQAILGLVLVLSPALVFTIINPSILNLSLNLPALNTPQGTSTNTSPTQVNGQQEARNVSLDQQTGGYLPQNITCQKKDPSCSPNTQSTCAWNCGDAVAQCKKNAPAGLTPFTYAVCQDSSFPGGYNTNLGKDPASCPSLDQEVVRCSYGKPIGK